MPRCSCSTGAGSALPALIRKTEQAVASALLEAWRNERAQPVQNGDGADPQAAVDGQVPDRGAREDHVEDAGSRDGRESCDRIELLSNRRQPKPYSDRGKGREEHDG